MQSGKELISLSYCSRASFSAAPRGYGVHPEVNRILVHSRRHNRERGIGGVLHFGDGCFFQYLEGSADRVDGLFARICRDTRHYDVQRLTRRPIGSRRFEAWSMKFVAIERLIEELLRRHDLDRFDPYQFTPAIIDDVVMTCIQSAEVAPSANPDPAFGRPRRRSFWQRLVGQQNASRR
jgi:hypothetical protein